MQTANIDNNSSRERGRKKEGGGGGLLLVENTFALECVCVIPNGMDGIHFEIDNLYIEKNKCLQAAGCQTTETTR